jgi:hypothetical protein
MFKHTMNNNKFRVTLLTAAIAVLAVGVSLPAEEKDKPLSHSELKSLVGAAETKADHERIAQHFDAEADRYEAEAKEHGDLAAFYEKHTPSGAKYPGGMKTFQHCDSVSKSLTQAAKDSRALASEHREMGKGAK